MYLGHYCDAYNYVIIGIKGRFDKPQFKWHSAMQSALLKSGNSFQYHENYNINV